MRLEIFAKNIELTEGIKTAINEKLEFLNKFLKENTCVDVTVKVEKETQIIKVITVYKSQIIEVTESTDNLYKSIDKVADTLKFKLSKVHGCAIDKKRSKVHLGAIDIDEDIYEEKNNKKITKRKSFLIKPMSEEEAILQMELLKHPSFMFINADLDFVMCLLYKKKDGSYGIIEGLLDE